MGDTLYPKYIDELERSLVPCVQCPGRVSDWQDTCHRCGGEQPNRAGRDKFFQERGFGTFNDICHTIDLASVDALKLKRALVDWINIADYDMQAVDACTKLDWHMQRLNETAKSKHARLLDLILESGVAEAEAKIIYNDLQTQRGRGGSLHKKTIDWLSQHGSAALRPPQDLPVTRIGDWLESEYGIILDGRTFKDHTS